MVPLQDKPDQIKVEQVEHEQVPMIEHESTVEFQLFTFISFQDA